MSQKTNDSKESPDQKDHNLIFDYSDDRKPKASAPGTNKRATDKMLIGGIVALLVLFAAVMGYIYWQGNKRPLTIEDLHQMNFKGELEPSQGYIYNNAYSFVKYQDQWYTTLMSQSGNSHYNFAFRYSPKDVEDVPVSGRLDEGLFNNATEYYITFNPLGDNLSNTVLAVNDLNQHMINTFLKTPIPACDRNETEACATRPIITCESADSSSIVVAIEQSRNPAVELDGNCITLGGEGLGQVKAVDRLLYHFYNIME
jgi:hypothetical protein